MQVSWALHRGQQQSGVGLGLGLDITVLGDAAAAAGSRPHLQVLRKDLCTWALLSVGRLYHVSEQLPKQEIVT